MPGSIDLNSETIDLISTIHEKKDGKFWSRFFLTRIINKSNSFRVIGAIIERSLLRKLHEQTVKLNIRIAETGGNFQVMGPADQ